jgi:hypothetical protein
MKGKRRLETIVEQSTPMDPPEYSKSGARHHRRHLCAGAFSCDCRRLCAMLWPVENDAARGEKRSDSIKTVFFGVF